MRSEQEQQCYPAHSTPSPDSGTGPLVSVLGSAVTPRQASLTSVLVGTAGLEEIRSWPTTWTVPKPLLPSRGQVRQCHPKPGRRTAFWSVRRERGNGRVEEEAEAAGERAAST